MKNNLLSKIKKGFTKKDAVYLIVIGVMSGLMIGSLGHPGMHIDREFDFKTAERQNHMQDEPRGHHRDFWFDGNEQNQLPAPTPSVSSSATPSATSGA